MVVDAFNSRTWEAEADIPVSLTPTPWEAEADIPVI